MLSHTREHLVKSRHRRSTCSPPPPTVSLVTQTSKGHLAHESPPHFPHVPFSLTSHPVSPSYQLSAAYDSGVPVPASSAALSTVPSLLHTPFPHTWSCPSLATHVARPQGLTPISPTPSPCRSPHTAPRHASLPNIRPTRQLLLFLFLLDVSKAPEIQRCWNQISDAEL